MYQKIIFVGNLGNDPEMRYLPNGTPVTSFSVAVNRRWTDTQSGQPVDETTWFRVKVWNKPAEVANQYLSKGQKVLVEGVLTPDRQTGGPAIFTRRDGTAGASFEVRAETVRFLSGREDGSGSASSGGGSEASYSGGGHAEEEDIPF